MKNWPLLDLPKLPLGNLPKLKLSDSNLGVVQIESNDIFRMYVCGITPYDSTHLGHAATYLTFDLINRYLSAYGCTVEFIENITDVDDPLLIRAKRDGVDWRKLATSQTDQFISDMTALRVLPPKQLVNVSDSIHLIENFIDSLNEGKALYKLDSDYYFDASRYLKYLKISQNEAISIFAERGGDPQRVGKHHPLDPLIWSANVPGEPGWNSKYGFGRPGWHIECTAIACEYLASNTKQTIIELQGGGSDLIFPHHFMSEQIVRAAYGKDFAKYFVHTAMIGLDGEKMSKSKGNLVFVSELISQGVDPMTIRWALLHGHYQKDRSWSNELLVESAREVNIVRAALSMSESANGTDLVAEIIEDLSNNLDTPSALKRLVDWAQESKKDHNHAGVVSRAIDTLLGLAL